MITLSNLSMRFGGKVLFTHVSLQLNPGQHYGLVGANGCGKSTFIKLLAGEIIPEAGEIVTPSLSTLGILKQDHFLYEECVIRDVVLMGQRRLWEALQTRDELLQKNDFNEADCERLEAVEKVVISHQGYTASSRAAKLLEGLGLPDEVQSNLMKTLSGGYKLRVLLAQVLFSEPDILLLDEPTNHLDLFSIRWLEGYLKSFPGLLLISSHDRDFLNATCNHVVDMDYGTIKIYKGNYDAFEETKLLDLSLNETLLEKHNKKKQEIQEFIDRFKAKASKARQAQSKMRLVEKISHEMEQLGMAPSSRQSPNVAFEQCRPSGAIPLVVKGITKTYSDKKVLSEISFQIERGERIAIVGTNGIGKSTLLEILTQGIKADAGTYEWGFAVQYAYFPQDHAKHVNGNQTVLEWLSQADRQTPEEKLRQILGCVLFSGDDVHKSVRVLSGGEAARLLLARMMLLKHNVLIFDEPTNHLDMEATENLIEALQSYEGSILFVSHNRHFISHIATRILEITPQHGLMDFKCTFSEYLAKREFDLLSASHKMDQNKASNTASEGKRQHQEQKNQRKLKNQIEKRITQAEEKCHRLEKQIYEIDALLASPGYYQKASVEEQKGVLAKKESLEQQLSIAFQDWEEASKNIYISNE